VSEDRALIDRATGGEADALDALARKHRPAVRRTALAVLGDEDAAEDVAQDAMIRMQASLPGFRGEAELGTWLYRVTLNLCQDHLRRTRRRRGDVPLHDAPSSPAFRREERPDETVDRERARAAVRAALAALPEDQREVLTLRYMADLSYAEIARITATPQGTVASRVFRALVRLGQDLEPRHLEVIK
jgi:RNA polymerase sigma-70 factor (ECF subfamily)